MDLNLDAYAAAVYRGHRSKDRLRIRTPAAARHPWMVEVGRQTVKQDGRSYSAGRTWFTWTATRKRMRTVVDALVRQYGSGRVLVIMDFVTQQKCAPACRAANPDTWWDCVCGCLGENHGDVGIGLGWTERGTYAISTEYSRRLWVA